MHLHAMDEKTKDHFTLRAMAALLPPDVSSCDVTADYHVLVTSKAVQVELKHRGRPLGTIMFERAFSNADVERAARTAHEVNRAYCAGLGDMSQLPWEEAPAWQRASAIQGVGGVIGGNGPGESHKSWLKQKLDEGWVYGEAKDEAKKEHPCLVPFDELPRSQQAKDALFVATVRGVLDL